MIPRIKIMSEEKRRRRKIFFGSIAAIIVLIIIFAISYYFFIPRVDVSVKTVFYETIGGPIFVQAKISNHGTTEIENIFLNISVYKINENNDTFIIKGEWSIDSLKSFANFEKGVNFTDDQYAKYRLIIYLSFKTEKNNYSEKYTYIAEEYAFLFWEEKIQKIEI